VEADPVKRREMVGQPPFFERSPRRTRPSALKRQRAGLDLFSMSARPITKELVQQVSDDLRTRYDLDEEDVRALGARLAEQDLADRHDQNIAFAQQFTAEHRETFDRLGQ
jgi:hypothetical protein